MKAVNLYVVLCCMTAYVHCAAPSNRQLQRKFEQLEALRQQIKQPTTSLFKKKLTKEQKNDVLKLHQARAIRCELTALSNQNHIIAQQLALLQRNLHSVQHQEVAPEDIAYFQEIIQSVYAQIYNNQQKRAEIAQYQQRLLEPKKNIFQQ